LGKILGKKPVAKIENHHNFAWKEKQSTGEELIVHRKGATPAGKGVMGIIPGSMSAPGFIVEGKGESRSLNSASHGAGRHLSRRKAAETMTRSKMIKYLDREKITLIGGGVDESPVAYKNIHDVMEAQVDLVDVVGTFYPKIVRMDKY
jgi:tRNA-splicing ligase RtcB